MSLTRAIIVAGGLGSRLGSLVHNRPKPLLSIVGKPLLGHQLDFLLQNGFKDIFISSGHQSSLIKQYINSIPEYREHVFIIQDQWKAGSGGCLQFLPPYDSYSLVLFGDIAIDMDLKAFIHFHHTCQAEVSLVLQINDHPWESDLVKINKENKCTSIYCKPHSLDRELEGYMIAGLFILEPSFIKKISFEQETDLVRNLIAPAIERGQPIFGYLTQEYLDDIGTPERYKRIKKEWVNNRV